MGKEKERRGREGRGSGIEKWKRMEGKGKRKGREVKRRRDRGKEKKRKVKKG